MTTPDAYRIDFQTLSAPLALAHWQTLIDDLDTLQPALLEEPEGQGPMHDALAVLEAHILAFEPATIGQAHAVLALTDHDLGEGLTLDRPARAARGRAMAFLATLAKLSGEAGHGC